MVGGQENENQETSRHVDDEHRDAPPRTKGVSQADLLPHQPTVASRRIAIIVTDGYDATALDDVKSAIRSVDATPFIISPRRSPILAAPNPDPSSPPRSTLADYHLDSQRSTQFDAVYIPESSTITTNLATHGRLLHWIREAFGHLKPLAATGEAIQVLEKALALPQVLMSRNGTPVASYGVVTLRDVLPESFTGGVCLAADAKAFMSQFLWATSQHRCREREMDGLSGMVAY
ncbi:hypothetical protein CDD82_371 [Ophiocordyceps australis]|uniref:catalase n=1 Tax=Ophiocordyceps australis TaxID=1399860 RepID=A0A2C5YM21_9HYPO|nr:hypothetical protein CDD82_371 [Ophiocordyceps australis]